jgi:hypothetical protein
LALDPKALGLVNIDLFLYSYEADFIQGLLKKTEKKFFLSQSFNSTCRYIDDILSLTNSRHANYVDPSVLTATLYQGNPDRNHNLWNIK